MIQGRKPNGYLVTGDPLTLRKVEAETRQCCHCQYMWQYEPFKEARARNIRGFCLRCYGFTCERAECHAEQRQMLLEYPDRPCISFEEYYRRRLERVNSSPHWEVTPSGVLRPRDEYSDIPGLEGLKA